MGPPASRARPGSRPGFACGLMVADSDGRPWLDEYDSVVSVILHYQVQPLPHIKNAQIDKVH
jgi:hypothetical protein